MGEKKPGCDIGIVTSAGFYIIWCFVDLYSRFKQAEIMRNWWILLTGRERCCRLVASWVSSAKPRPSGTSGWCSSDLRDSLLSCCVRHISDKTKQLSRCFVPKAISPELAAPSSLVQIGTYDQGQGIFKWSEVSSTDVLCQLYDLILSSAPKTFVTLSPPLWLWRRSLTPWICELMFKLMLFVAIVWWGCCDWHLPSKMMGNLPLCLLLLVWNYLCPSMYIVQGVF